MMPSPRRTMRSRVTAIPLWAFWQRFALLAFMALAIWMLVLGQVRPQLLAPARIWITDSFAPVLDAMTRPVELASEVGAAWQSWVNTHDEVLRLRAENARLKLWQQSGAALAVENRSLKQLLNFRDEPPSTAIAARVIATAGGPLADGMIVTAGRRDGVRDGMAAVTADGLIGRVVEVGEWSARILLLTDINSRIPVMLEEGGERGILVGGDNPGLRLLYMPSDAALHPGARIVTSGHGGIFPPRIPVGIVTAQGRDGAQVVPVADSGRVNYVRLVDFSLAGGASNQFARTLSQAGQRN